MIAAAIVAAAAPTIAAMRWERRVLVVSAPAAGDAALAAQRRALAGWREGAAERDLTVVEVVGDRVTGAHDSAALIRARYRLPPARFATVLIGKDGGVKLRSAEPLAPARLAATIDAMPMRRAGQR